MPEALQTYTFESSGLWNPRHTVTGPDGVLGVLDVKRNAWGMIASAEFKPEKGEVLIMRRDPGLLRAQFSMWTADREWLASSLRWSFFKRPITIHTGTKPQTLIPLPSFGPGWVMMAPKTGEVGKLSTGLFGSKSTLEVYRRIDFELVLFAYFLGSLVKREFLLPGPIEHSEAARASAAPSKA